MNLWNTQRILLSTAFCFCVAVSSVGQQFTSLASFNSINGSYPSAPLIQGLDGNFYGTTVEGGSLDVGTVFRITPTGQLTKLHDFNDVTDGAFSYAGLMLATNGNLYGVTNQGGAHNDGAIFQITRAGQFSTIYAFCSRPGCDDGSLPAAALIQAADGNFYGTTSEGGADNAGSVFRITPAGKLTTLYSFCSLSKCADGSQPIAPLVQGRDGNFYSTTFAGGTHQDGTVFKLTPSGQLTTLYSFCAKAACVDGKNPYGGGLIQGKDGDFYGSTIVGGTDNLGTIFKITGSGGFTNLHSFVFTDGESPYAGLVQATDGNFYGITQIGGASDMGVIFQITPSGQLTILYDLCSQSGCIDGSIGYGGLIQSTNGTLYGPAQSGGTSNACPGAFGGCGTIFSLEMGLGPFVETVPISGKVGAHVLILGNDLSAASKVAFNGTAATFTILSNTAIKVTVPTGATSGPVGVTTPNGTLRSNKTFHVAP